MGKQTEFTDLKNMILLVSFNQRVNQVDIQPVVIEAKAEAITPEGATAQVSNKLNIGDVVQTPLSNEELYKLVFGISEVLAKALSGILLEGIAQDVSAVDTSGVKPLGVADIITKV